LLVSCWYWFWAALADALPMVPLGDALVLVVGDRVVVPRAAAGVLA